MKICTALVSAAFAASGAFVALPALTAHAAQPPSVSCWGVVTSQRASTAHDIGTHVSSQDTPHAGLANVARESGGKINAMILRLIREERDFRRYGEFVAFALRHSSTARPFLRL